MINLYYTSQIVIWLKYLFTVMLFKTRQDLNCIPTGRMEETTWSYSDYLDKIAQVQ